MVLLAAILADNSETAGELGDRHRFVAHAAHRQLIEHAGRLSRFSGTIRWNEDPLASVQALQNGELDLIAPLDEALGPLTRGEEIYADSCLSCHGPELRGDGPAAGGMQPPPADFSAPHTRAHDDATLIYWVRHGKQGTAMPAFGGKLSDDDIADVLSYIARQQREMDAATPEP